MCGETRQPIWSFLSVIKYPEWRAYFDIHYSLHVLTFSPEIHILGGMDDLGNYRARGPFPQSSKLEKSMKNTLMDITRISSHKFFLQSCLELKVVPRGLLRKVPMATCKPNKDLLKLFDDINRGFSFSLMEAIMTHYDQLLSELTESYQVLDKELECTCSPEDCSDIRGNLMSFKEVESSRLMKDKVKKLQRDINSHLDTGHYDVIDSVDEIEQLWVPILGLKNREKWILVRGKSYVID